MQTLTPLTPSRQKRVLAYLRQGGRLTVRKALFLFSTTELRNIVYQLRKRGYPITDRRLTGIAADGCPTRFKEYYIHADNRRK